MLCCDVLLYAVPCCVILFLFLSIPFPFSFFLFLFTFLSCLFFLFFFPFSISPYRSRLLSRLLPAACCLPYCPGPGPGPGPVLSCPVLSSSVCSYVVMIAVSCDLSSCGLSRLAFCLAPTDPSASLFSLDHWFRNLRFSFFIRF